MPRLPKEEAWEPTYEDYPYEDDAWLESRTKHGRPSWKRVKVLRRLVDKLIKTKGGHTVTVMRTALVHVEGESEPRPIDLDRLCGGRSHKVHPEG